MSSSSDRNVRGEEIIAIVNDINYLRAELAAKGITGIDDEDRMEAMDIIRRIERKLAMKGAAA